MNIPMPAGIRLVAFADDVGVVAMAHTTPVIEKAINPALAEVANWMAHNSLTLAAHKTEAVMLTRKWAFATQKIVVEGQAVSVSPSIKYLGLRIDARRGFYPHIKEVASRAAATASAVARLMPNTSGPGTAKRRLLASVVLSKLLYAAENWAPSALSAARNRHALNAALRPVALKVARAYRTVST